MKVLVISHMYPSTFRAVEGIFVHQQVKELQKKGCDIRVISPVPLTPFPIKYLTGKWSAYSKVPPTTTWDGIKVYYPRFLQFPKSLFFASSGKRMYLGIRKLVAELYRDFKFDIIHAHVALPSGFASMMVKKEYRKPLVVTIHGQDLQVTIYRNDACRKALAEVFQGADRIATVSTKLQRVAEANFGFAEKLAVIPNGISPDEIASEKTKLVSRYAGSRVILSVSNLIKSKGIDLNIKAISQLAQKHPDLKYVVIGIGPEMSSLKRLARDLNLENRVDFLGELPHEKAMDYMAVADIFSLPSWQEGFGVVYLEAMAHSKPIIACQGEGIEDVIENNQTGLMVGPKDVPNLAKAIEFLLDNPQRAREIGQKAKMLVLENYTCERNARKYIKIYEELTAHDSQGSLS
jgi:teichuronic acid biosynthesis glycosyltransferase TuaC